jgi:hypothetical protein
MRMKWLMIVNFCLVGLHVAFADTTPKLGESGTWTSFWNGTYEYISPQSAFSNRSTTVLDMVLTIQRNGKCTLSISGPQTNSIINCSALPKGKNLLISFGSYEPGEQNNSFFNPNLNNSELMFALIPADMSHGLTTEWLGVKPSTATVDHGKYFLMKAGDEQHPVLLGMNDPD